MNTNEDTIYTVIPPAEVDEAAQYRRPLPAGIVSDNDYYFGDVVVVKPMVE